MPGSLTRTAYVIASATNAGSVPIRPDVTLNTDAANAITAPNVSCRTNEGHYMQLTSSIARYQNVKCSKLRFDLTSNHFIPHSLQNHGNHMSNHNQISNHH